MTEFEIASLTARYVIGGGQILIGLGQIAVVCYFGRQMVLANEARTLAGKQQEQQAEHRHAETMTALQALIRGLDNQGEALKKQGQALETLIARTSTSGSA